jgi:hypothetical protein
MSLVRVVPRIAVAVAAFFVVIAGSAWATTPPHGLPAPSPTKVQALAAEPGDPGDGDEGDESSEDILRANEEYAEARTAPADTVDAAAFVEARNAASALPVFGGSWTELTTLPYQNDDPNYRDPVFSNSFAGWRLVTGRATALAVDGNTIWAGFAAGGVWKSTNGGGSWRPVFDNAASLSIGSLAVDPADHSLWVGTGEANTNSDAYAGTGVLRSADGGRTFQQVGGTGLQNHLIGRLVFDGQGDVYAATSMGLYERRAKDLTSDWTLVLRPGVGPFGTTFVNDVVVRPGTHGKSVLANVGWREGTAYNGFYASDKSGRAGTWRKLAVNGIADADIGRSTFAYSSDGSRLYAIVQSPRKLLAPDPDAGNTNLQGVFVSPNGSPDGPYKLIADEDKLVNSGSALKGQPGYGPGVQSWYNQFLAVDPSDPRHVYVGLEEVFETTDGGKTFTTPGPYWNFPFACFQANPASCPPTTHPDQHAVAIAGNRVFVGDDGGIYSRALHRASGWSDHNAALRTLQYYFAGVGRLNGGLAYWGGLQDNGESLQLPGASQMVSPFGGDGGDTLVDPDNANRAVVEYTNLDMALTTNGGQSDGTTPAFREMTPSCFAATYTPDPCDPTPRFTAPFRGDVKAPTTHWVAGGQYIWETTKGFDTTCSATACDWKIIHDTGVGRSTTALSDVGDVVYAGWCGPCNPPTTEGGAPFASGIDTNYGGTWHALSSPVLPNRFVAAVIADPDNAAHVYAVYNGFSRRWIEGGGTGHVFESADGGATWTDISGNLPDAPGDDLVVDNGALTLATDIGVFTAKVGGGAGTQWSRLGSGLPTGAPSNDLTQTPDGGRIVAATHGRGLWSIPTP